MTSYFTDHHDHHDQQQPQQQHPLTLLQLTPIKAKQSKSSTKIPYIIVRTVALKKARKE
jgi:hypothetical protein